MPKYCTHTSTLFLIFSNLVTGCFFSSHISWMSMTSHRHSWNMGWEKASCYQIRKNKEKRRSMGAIFWHEYNTIKYQNKLLGNIRNIKVMYPEWTMQPAKLMSVTLWTLSAPKALFARAHTASTAQMLLGAAVWSRLHGPDKAPWPTARSVHWLICHWLVVWQDTGR